MRKLFSLTAEQAELLRLLYKDWKYIRFPTLQFLPLGVQEIPSFVAHRACNLDAAFLRRVQLCFQKSSDENTFDDESSIWKTLYSNNSAFVKALLSDDPENLRPHVANLYGGATMYGMAHVQEFIIGKKRYTRKNTFRCVCGTAC